MSDPKPALRLCPECGLPNQPERAEHDREMGFGPQCRCTMEDIVGSLEDWDV